MQALLWTTLLYQAKATRVTIYAGYNASAMFAYGDYCFRALLVGMESGLDWDRLAAAVRAARGARSQKDIGKQGGPSDTTIGKIESGEWRPKRAFNDTLDKLDTGLGWRAGSAQRVLHGGGPSPMFCVSGTTQDHNQQPRRQHAPRHRHIA
jgi:hypothetical protein